MPNDEVALRDELRGIRAPSGRRGARCARGPSPRPGLPWPSCACSRTCCTGRRTCTWPRPPSGSGWGKGFRTTCTGRRYRRLSRGSRSRRGRSRVLGEQAVGVLLPGEEARRRSSPSARARAGPVSACRAASRRRGAPPCSWPRRPGGRPSARWSGCRRRG